MKKKEISKPESKQRESYLLLKKQQQQENCGSTWDFWEIVMEISFTTTENYNLNKIYN